MDGKWTTYRRSDAIGLNGDKSPVSVRTAPGLVLQLGPVPELARKYMGSALKAPDFVKGFESRFVDWNFNMHKFNKQVQGKALPVIFMYLCQANELVDKFCASVFTLENYVNRINASYPTANPFHNSCHSADVVATCFWVLHHGKASSICRLTSLDVFSALFAAMIHDVDHPGRTNNYQIALHSSLALRYNDRSVLENHHCSFAYMVMDAPGCNVLTSMTSNHREEMRNLVVNMVLATDVAKHFYEYGLLKARLQDKSFPDRDKPADKELILKSILHACDISNPTKGIEVTVEWTSYVMAEFFQQGDREKQRGLPISMFMDRTTTNIATCQVGFIDALVLPLFKGLQIVFPTLHTALTNLKENREFWEDHIEIFAEYLSQDDHFPPEKLMTLISPDDLESADDEGSPDAEGSPARFSFRGSLTQNIRNSFSGAPSPPVQRNSVTKYMPTQSTAESPDSP
jgi:cAMP-specific phosphodiesterase 4